jgi:hypothetical protein
MGFDQHQMAVEIFFSINLKPVLGIADLDGIH